MSEDRKVSLATLRSNKSKLQAEIGKLDREIYKLVCSCNHCSTEISRERNLEPTINYSSYQLDGTDGKIIQARTVTCNDCETSWEEYKWQHLEEWQHSDVWANAYYSWIELLV